LKPRTVFEIGSNAGGSALWFGDLLTTFEIGSHVYSLDIIRVESVNHPRVTFLEGDGRALGKSLSDNMLTSLPRPWLVIEDADHAYETSIAVLRFFHRWLRPGEFIVIEDGIISDLSGDAACNSGPHRALREFLSTHPAVYEIASEYCDFFGHNVTWCTNGFLRRR
jgi:cephalosporin hydroxylase